MSCYALITATITVISSTKEQILAGRILNCESHYKRHQQALTLSHVLADIYVGMELSVIPVFQSEIVPAPVSGLVVGTYQFSLIVCFPGPSLYTFDSDTFQLGGIVINAVCLGTSNIMDNRSWRIPLGLFYIVPTIIICLIWFIPEVRQELRSLSDCVADSISHSVGF